MSKQTNTSSKRITTNISDPKNFTYVRAPEITPDSTPEEDQAAIEEMTRAMIKAIFGMDVEKKEDI